MDGWMDGWIDKQLCCSLFSLFESNNDFHVFFVSELFLKPSKYWQ